MSTVFITATGTSAGKTFVAAALVHQMRAAGKTVRALKPIVTGFDEELMRGSDPAVLLEALGEDVSLRTIAVISPFRYRAPLAPSMAARAEAHELDFRAVVEFCRGAERANGTLLIEGVGGVMVPLGQETVLDWIAALECPAILVAGSYLGALSHTLTALDALAHRGVAVSGVIVSESPESPVGLEETARAIGGFCGAPVVVLPRLPGPQPWMRAPDLTGVLPA